MAKFDVVNFSQRREWSRPQENIEMARIHHATVARAGRLGCAITETQDGTFMLTRHEDGAISEAHSDPKELVERLLNDQVEFMAVEDEAEVETPDADEEEMAENFAKLRSGVMVITYHRRYTANGGGCADTLDLALRDLLVVETEEEGKHLDTDLLRRIAETNGVWVQKWAALNPGMQRMNLANRLRAILRNDENATVDLGEEGTGRFDVAYRPTKKTLRAIARRNAA